MPATRFRELQGPTLIDLSARTTPSGGDKAALALAQSLSSFSRTSREIIAPIIKRNLTKSGAAAGARAGEQGVPELKSTLTAFGRAYNNAALRSYAIQSEIDLDENAARLEAEAGTDPEAFRQGMSAMLDGILEEAPPEARTLITELYSKRAGAGLARIQTALANELRQESLVLGSEQVSRLTEKVAFLRSQDTPEAHAESELEEGKLFLLLDALEADGTLSESEAREAREDARRGIIFETVISRFKNEVTDVFGDPIGFIEDLKEANRTANTLTPEEEAKLENELLAELRERNALRAARNSQEIAEETARHEAGDRDATAGMLAGELTRTDLLQKVEDDELLPSVARTLLNELQSAASTPRRSDPETLFRFETNLLFLTEDEIRTEGSLTFDDRSKLILQRRKDEAGWKGTQVAKEAFDRIDRSLGIVRGTLSAKMLSEDEARQRDRAFTELYDVIDALPPEERQAAILEASERVIKTIVRANSKSEAEKAERALTEYQQQMGDPNDLSDRERRQYDVEIKRYENIIRENQQKSQG